MIYFMVLGTIFGHFFGIGRFLKLKYLSRMLNQTKINNMVSRQLYTISHYFLHFKSPLLYLTYIDNLVVIHPDIDNQSIAPYQHRTHNSHHHQNCILHYWFHHCNSHFQSNQVKDCNSDLHSKCNRGRRQCWRQDHSNHQNCNWHYLLHLSNNQFQSAKYVALDNLHENDKKYLSSEEN